MSHLTPISTQVSSTDLTTQEAWGSVQINQVKEKKQSENSVVQMEAPRGLPHMHNNK